MPNQLLPLCLALVLLLTTASPALTVAAPEEVARPTLRLLRSDAQGVLLELLTPPPQLETVSLPGVDGAARPYQRLVLPGAGTTSEPGRPQLLVMSYLLAAPPEAEVELRLLEAETQTVGGRVDLAPAPSPTALQEEFTPGELAWEPDPRAYAALEPYPAAPAGLGESAWLRDRRLLRLALYPYQVVPGEGRLLWNARLLVEVRFTGAELSQASEAASAAGDDPFADLIAGEVLNAAAARDWRAAPTLAASAALFSSNNPEAVGAAGTRYRIAITEDGLYRLDYAALRAAGLPVDTLDPATLRLESQGREVALYLQHDGDARFEPGESLLFFGERFRGDTLAERYRDENELWYTFERHYPDGTFGPWKPELNALMFEKYTAENVYWLSYGGAPGLRMQAAPQPPEGSSPPIAAAYRAVARFEEDLTWKGLLFSGEETWFWREIAGGQEAAFPFTLSALAASGEPARVWGEVAARNYNLYSAPDHRTRLYLNRGANPAAILDQTWDNRSRLAFEASVPHTALAEGQNELVYEALLVPGMASDRIEFDWFAVEYTRLFRAVGEALDFTVPQSGPWKYAISGFSGGGDYAALELADSFTPRWISGVRASAGTLTFTYQGAGGERLYAGRVRDLGAAALVPYTPPALTPADYVIVSPPELLEAAQALSAYRREGGLSTLVVNVEQLYDEFNFGIPHPLAIKNFLARTFDKSFWPRPPTYLVLLGDGHWNMHYVPFSGFDLQQPNYMLPHLAWVDPWQGEVDSANLLAAVTVDPKSGVTDPLPDVLVGRIPVGNAAELQVVLEKMRRFESGALDPNREQALFMADRADAAGDFKFASQRLIDDYFTPAGFGVERVYYDDLPDAATVKSALVDALGSRGALLLNYAGHGSVNRWGANLLENRDAAALVSAGAQPLVLSMTCLDGMWAYPTQDALAEALLLAPGAGATASFSPTGLGLSSGHDELNRGFFDYLFGRASPRLGQAALAAKLRLYAAGRDPDLLQTYTVFGDPALLVRFSVLESPLYQRVSLPLVSRR